MQHLHSYKIAKYAIAIGIFLAACSENVDKHKSTELITDAAKQDSIFNNLLTLTNNQIPENKKADSLAFLVLPVEASCPSCRKKTIDSILKHQANLAENHFIIITADGGRKTMNSYFKEQEAEIPDINGQLFLDSVNQAYKLEMFKNNPAIYYSARQKVYKKVLALPATVREDLREFFSGYRNDNHEN